MSPSPLPRRAQPSDLVFVSRPAPRGEQLVAEEWTFRLAGGRVLAERGVERVRSAAGSWSEGRDLDPEEGVPAEVLEQLGDALARERLTAGKRGGRA